MMNTSIDLIKDVLDKQVRVDYRANKEFLHEIVFSKNKTYPQSPSPIVYIISGGIASGKSTLCYNFLKYLNDVDLPFIGNDTIFELYFEGRTTFDRDYDEAREYVDKLINELIDNHISFAWETVFSKDKKVEVLNRLKANGYRIVCLFVGVNLETSIERSKTREGMGGNIVKPSFIEDRFNKINDYMKIIRQHFDEFYLFSNEHKLKLLYGKDTSSTFVAETLPNWAERLLQL